MRITKAEYARRRKALMSQMEPNSIAILPAAQVFIRNRDVEHNYRQDAFHFRRIIGRCRKASGGCSWQPEFLNLEYNWCASVTC